MFKVKDWTPCGAPLYEASVSFSTSLVWHLSADRKLALSTFGGFTCTDAERKKFLWEMRIPDFDRPWLPMIPNAESPAIVGSVALPKPIGNVWLASQNGKPWHLINEDGFDLASFFGGDPADNPNSAKATPGMDMTHAAAGRDGSITQAADGKLYIAAGETAYWNLEVTGLDKVKALPGGTINIPPAK
jgi:hypothetical protein